MLQLTFKPESEQFIPATKEYEDIWATEGGSILVAFREVTGLEFLQQRLIEAIIYEGPSSSGSLQTPMKLRASYPHQVKQGTLIHELAHRLIGPRHNRIEGVDEHRTMNLFLYDIWVKLYGKEFADSMVVVESERKGLYDYESAWKWFRTLSQEERGAIWNKFRELNVE